MKKVGLPLKVLSGTLAQAVNVEKALERLFALQSPQKLFLPAQYSEIRFEYLENSNEADAKATLLSMLSTSRANVKTLIFCMGEKEGEMLKEILHEYDPWFVHGKMNSSSVQDYIDEWERDQNRNIMISTSLLQEGQDYELCRMIIYYGNPLV